MITPRGLALITIASALALGLAARPAAAHDTRLARTIGAVDDDPCCSANLHERGDRSEL